MPGDLSDLIGPNAAPEKVAGGFTSVRAPVFSRCGFLLFCDTTPGRIVKWEDRWFEGKGKVSVLRENSRATGLTFDHEGRLLACERDRVTRTEKNRKITVLADHLDTPQDLVYAIDGSVYFSDAGPQARAVYQVTRHGRVRTVSSDPSQPDGVALAPNQQKLYVADILGRQIWVYKINGDGALRDGRVFAPARARGLKTDEGGNVWAAEDHAIAIYDAEGKRRGEVPLPEDPSNFTWGDNFRDLYVTAETSIYKIETKVNGTRTY
ncbi:MAG: SMP-30/gluconolactonase/LRE family protein [Terriglobia bacterium]